MQCCLHGNFVGGGVFSRQTDRSGCDGADNAHWRGWGVRSGMMLTPAIAVASVMLGQTSAEPTRVVPEQVDVGAWTLRLDARVWYAGPAGDVRMPGAANSARTDLSDLNADNPRLSPYGSLTLRAPAEKLFFLAQGSGTSLNASVTAAGAFQLGNIAVNAGDNIRSEVDLASFELLLGYGPISLVGAPGEVTRLDLGLMGGVRLVEQRFTFTSGASQSRMEDTYAAPAIGARLNAQLSREFSAEATSIIGLWPDRTSADIDINFNYTPGGKDDWLTLQVGYRLLAFEFSRGSGASTREFSGSLAGLYAGLQLKF